VSAGKPSKTDRDKALHGRLVQALTEQWQLIVIAVQQLSQDPAGWNTPTRLGWTAGELAVHLEGNVAYVVAALEALGNLPPEFASRELVSVAEYYAGHDAEAADQRARSSAADDPDQLVARLLATTARAVGLLAQTQGNERVVAAGRLTLLDTFLITRVIEAVVHGLDLPDPITPARPALREAVRALAALLAVGSPGNSVEVRIPPHTVVQCIEGPRHTRGTPPNVVEAEPVAFVEVAAGRLDWTAAVADGRIRASGERADLSGLLPLL
jgi:uncharacterized protein (TIGR03083 family)